jgi:hypothetical protein
MTAKAEYPGDPAADRGGVMRILADARRGHAGLFWFAVSMGLVAVGAVVGVVVDVRVLLGPLLSPDPATPTALGVLLAAGAGSTALILAGHRAAGRPT